MITIRIKNAKEIVKRNKGWFISKIGGKVIDLESRVEDKLVKQLKISLAEKGIEAEIKRSDE